MNRILRFIYAALIVSTAVACHTSEIDNPNNDNQDKPKAYDNIILTAGIKQTRVDYSINGDKLEQRWAENDVIYGFYGDTKADKDKKIVFTVNSVDESGVASLSPGDGWSDFLSVYKGGNLAIRLVYTGCTTTYNLFDANGDILIDMINQGTGRIPACMHADSYAKRTDDDITYIQFQFDNDCSIIEVFSFTGVKENHSYISGDSATLGSIQVSNIFETGKYSLDDTGKLTFAGIESTTDSPATINFSGDEWKVTTAGDITYAGNIKPVFIAAVPFDTSRSITVSAKLSGSEDSFFNQTYTDRTFEKGHSYYIMADPVVAKTVDNVYFKTVNAAFSHAAELSEDTSGQYNTAETNIVTLVRDCGLAGVIKQDGSYVSNVEGGNPLLINGYDVTLDLNGHVLTLAGGELFVVNGVEGVEDYVQEDSQTLNTFIINDFKGKNADGNYDGKIYYLSDGKEEYSSDGEHIIRNLGSVQIDGGTLWNNDDWSAVRNYKGAVLTVNGGELYSDSWRTIHDEGGTVIVNDGKVSSRTSPAIYSDKKGTVEITGGVIGNNDTYSEAIQVLGGTECTISGGVIYSLGQQACAIGCRSKDGDDPVLTIKWPEESDDSSYEPIIYSAGVYSTTLPISAYMSGVNNAEIIIKGGYLISNNIYGAFYCDCDYVNKDSNLNLNLTDFNFGGFYSNMSCVIMDGSNPSGSLRDLSAEGGKGLPDDNGQHFYADPKGSFDLTDINFSGVLYKIDSGYPGTVQKPVEIDGVVWAPVNCGYDTDHPDGLLYQWGRKYGQDLNLSSDDLVEMVEPLVEYPDISNTYAGNFFYGSLDLYYPNKFNGEIEKLWDASDYSIVEDPQKDPQHTPVKSTNDPCPKGWRVPTCYDFALLGDEDLIKLSLKKAGMRNEYGEVDGLGDWGYYWTSSVGGDSTPYPWFFAFSSSGNSFFQGYTQYGCSIRCVKE